MKREILFRGLDSEGIWRYGYLTKKGKYDGYFCIENSHGEGGFKDWSSHIVTPETVGQYTGLTDKNGNKIFEGDYDEKYEVIEWCEKRNGYSFFTYDHPTKELIHCNCYSCEGHYELSDVLIDTVIIGNIHENNEQ